MRQTKSLTLEDKLIVLSDIISKCQESGLRVGVSSFDTKDDTNPQKGVVLVLHGVKFENGILYLIDTKIDTKEPGAEA